MLKKLLIGAITASVLITTSCVLLGLVDLNWSDGVNCGGHMAETCSRCSEGMFSKLQSFNPWRDEEYWCNGQCVWSNKDDCVLKGWFKRWIYENGDKESILGLRMPTISETLDVLFFSVIFGCFALPLYKIFFELNPGHGKSYKIESGNIKTCFNDVKGNEEVKEEIRHVVEFLKNPNCNKFGGKLPRGVLMSGLPGTGKTLMAKALAGEAKVDFFYAAASEFECKYVGEGVRAIKKLFREARGSAPSVIFIDEIDCIGKRTTSEYHPYANQTINQLLTEMDGFNSSKEAVVVIGATNFSENIDEALKRSGRLDIHVEVSLPDINGRQELFEHYLGKLTDVDEKIDLKLWASKAIKFSGADIENVVNMAAIRAAAKAKQKLSHEDIEYAFEKREKTDKKQLNNSTHSSMYN